MKNSTTNNNKSICMITITSLTNITLKYDNHSHFRFFLQIVSLSDWRTSAGRCLWRNWLPNERFAQVQVRTCSRSLLNQDIPDLTFWQLRTHKASDLFSRIMTQMKRDGTKSFLDQMRTVKPSGKIGLWYRILTWPWRQTWKETIMSLLILGFSSLPSQVYRRSLRRGFEFTLMVVGESGLGKSTLVSMLKVFFILSKKYLLLSNFSGELNVPDRHLQQHNWGVPRE